MSLTHLPSGAFRSALMIETAPCILSGYGHACDVGAKLNLRTAAKRLGPKVKTVQRALSGMKAVDFHARANCGQVTIEGELLSGEDIMLQPPGSFCGPCRTRMTMALGVEFTR